MTACSTALGVTDETMTRIIGGSAGGRRIATPRGANTRPTSDRVREALFSAIESWCGSLSGLRFLDLYAGSGAVGPRGVVARRRGGHARRAGPPYRLADRRQRPRPRLHPRPRGRRPGRRRRCARPPVGAVRRGVPRPALRPPEPTVVADLAALRDHGLAGARARWWSSSAASRGRRAALARGLRATAGRRSTARPMLWYVHAAHP